MISAAEEVWKPSKSLSSYTIFAITQKFVGVVDERTRDTYLRDNNGDPLRAMIQACSDGNLGAVISLSPYVEDANGMLPGPSGMFTCYYYNTMMINNRNMDSSQGSD